MDKKRILFIFLFIGTTIGFGVALYLVFFAPKETGVLPNTGQNTTITPNNPTTFPQASQADGRTQAGANNTTPPGSNETTQQNPQIPINGSDRTRSQVTSAPVLGVSVGTGGDLRFYNKEDGKFYEQKNGELTPMSDTVFFNAQSVTWSQTQDVAVIEYPDGSNIAYNFNTKKQTTLPKHWEEFSFNPISSDIAAKSITIAPENRYLVTSDASGKNISYVAALGENGNKVSVDWAPHQQILGFSKTGSPLGANRQEIIPVSPYNENLPALVVEGRGFVSEWSKTGAKLLYSVYSNQTDYKPELWVVNGETATLGDDRRALRINTWPKKCTFADDRFVYCGVPNSLPTGAGYAPSIADNTPDTLYKIDTETGIKTEIETPDTYTVESLTISPDGQTLYITDTQSSGIYSIPI